MRLRRRCGSRDVNVPGRAPHQHGGERQREREDSVTGDSPGISGEVQEKVRRYQEFAARARLVAIHRRC